MHSGAKPPEYEGGAKSVFCHLCPMRCGLFKQTAGPKAVWVHNVCALWQSPEVTVLNVDRPDAVRFGALLSITICIPCFAKHLVAHAVHLLFGLRCMPPLPCKPACSAAGGAVTGYGGVCEKQSQKRESIKGNLCVQIKCLELIKPERKNSRCTYCQQSVGATVKCAHNKCHTAFHPLCARRAGCFSICRHAPLRGRPTYKTWCRSHSDMAQRRERESASAARRSNKRVDVEAPRPSKKAAAPAPVATGPVIDPALVAELRELHVRLAAHTRARDFLHAVRYDLETARSIASQVRSNACLTKEIQLVHCSDAASSSRRRHHDYSLPACSTQERDNFGDTAVTHCFNISASDKMSHHSHVGYKHFQGCHCGKSDTSDRICTGQGARARKLGIGARRAPRGALFVGPQRGVSGPRVTKPGGDHTQMHRCQFCATQT